MRQIYSAWVESGISTHHKVLGEGVDSALAIRDDGECFSTLGLTFVLMTIGLCHLEDTISSGGLQRTCQESSLLSRRHGMLTEWSTCLGIGGVGSASNFSEYAMVIDLND